MVDFSVSTSGWIGTSIAMVLVTIGVIIRNWNRWHYVPKLQKGQAPLPPGDMGWPLIGQIRDFLRAFKSQDPDSFIGGFIRRYGKLPLFTTHMFGQPTVLAISPASVKKISMEGHTFLSGWPKSARAVLGRKSFVVLEGEELKRLRRLTAQGIQGQETLNNFIPGVEQKCLAKLASWADKGQPFSAVQELHQFTFEVITHIFMSYPDGPMARELLSNFQTMVHGLRAMHVNLPGTAYNKSMQARKKVIKALQVILDERRAKTVKHNDVLESLLTLQDDDGSFLSDEEIIDTICVFLVAGHQSSTFTLCWAMILLQKNPEALKECREEQRRIHEAKAPGETLTFADFRSMTYLNSVIDETMRIVNVAPFVFRRVTKTTEVEGYTIPKDWFVELWYRAVHMDSDVYPDPYAFKPDRWKTFTPKAGEFVPFGLGNRRCIGNELAKLEMSIVLHHICLSYRWEPLNPDCPLKFLPHPQPVDGYVINFLRYHDMFPSLNSVVQ